VTPLDITAISVEEKAFGEEPKASLRVGFVVGTGVDANDGDGVSKVVGAKEESTIPPSLQKYVSFLYSPKL